MQYVLELLLGTLTSWVSLLVIIPIAQRLADFSMPPWPEALAKLAAVALGTNVIAAALDPLHWILGSLAAVVVFWTLMVKWFDVDLFGAAVIVVTSWVARLVVAGLLASLIPIG